MSRPVQAFAYDVVDVEYSAVLDRIVIASAFPVASVHVRDAAGMTDTSINIGGSPTSISVSPDGLTALAVGGGHGTLIDLAASVALRTFNITPDAGDAALGNGYAFVLPSGVAQEAHLHLVDVSSGSDSVLSDTITPGATAVLTKDGMALYAGSSTEVRRYAVKNGSLQFVDQRSVPACAHLRLSDDGTKLFTMCGTLTVSSDPAKDLQGGSSGVLEYFTIGDSALVQEEARVAVNYPATVGIRVSQQGYAVYLAPFPVMSGMVESDARFMFYSRQGDKLIVIVEADKSATLRLRFGVTIL